MLVDVETCTRKTENDSENNALVIPTRIMELTDSSEVTTRPPLGIDLNEIPSSSCSSPPPRPSVLPVHNQHHLSDSDPYNDPDVDLDLDQAELDSLDVVRSFHENPDPAPGLAAGLPGDGTGSAMVCGACGRPELRGHVVVCDGCERWFHLGCAGMRGRQAVNLVEWLCGECASGGVKSKRWPLGVKSKQILDINASPPSDGDVEPTEELVALRKQTLGDSSVGGNAFGAPMMHSNFLFAGNGFGYKNGSGLLMHALRLGFEDILQRTQTVDTSSDDVDLGFHFGRLRGTNNTAIRFPSRNPSEIFLQGLKEFVSERHGVLGEGWHVEFKHSIGSYELFAVYCSPDGKTFGSMSEVACYLGLSANCNSIDTDAKADGSPPLQESVHLTKKRKSKRFSLANGFSDNKETSINGYHKELLSNGQCMEIGDAKFDKVTRADMEEDGITESESYNEGLPVQLEDFFVLSLGKIDVRPSYHDVNLIWPVGYRSCWHDKVTGSLFMCEVSDGGDSGPVFKVRRFSCSALPIPDGSTVLFRTDLGHFPGQNDKEADNMIYHNGDCESDSSIEMILAEPSPPTDNDILACLQNSISGLSDGLQTCFYHCRIREDIGEISVEEHSSSSAWRMMSQKLIDAYSEIYKRRGALKFTCNHADNEMGSQIWDTNDKKCKVSLASLAKFCSSPSSVGIPVEYHGEFDTLAPTLSEWLEQDRFGVDAEFVQEIIEQLPGVETCSKYEILSNRSRNSVSLTVGNGFLMAKRKSGAEPDDSFGRSKKPRFAEDNVEDDCHPPPGTPLCSRLPPLLVGDIYQVWELLCRFHEILGLQEPFLLEDLEDGLIKPWTDGLNLPENLEKKVPGSQVVDLHRVDGLSGQISSPCNESRASVYLDNLHAQIPVETEVTSDAAQSRAVSVYHSRCCGMALMKAHSSLLRVLISELQTKVAAFVDPSFDSGESKSKRGRRKDVDSTIPAKRGKLNMLPINELTWPELARRYVLAFLAMDGNLDSAETTARESGKVFRCLQGDGGVICGSLNGVAGMEADALLLAEARKQIFGSLSRGKDVLTIEDEVTDASGACEKNTANDGTIPEWAQLLEPVRKLPTNVGTRIRKCVYDALEKCPPEWAKKRLEHSISKEVYKGNASGPTKKAVLSVLSDVLNEVSLQKSDKRNTRKISIPVSDTIMKQCRIVLRRTAAADDEKVFCTLLGRNLITSCDNDDEGLLGSPAMVSRPLDFRTIDLRLAVGAYGGSYESFLEDVRELWSNVRIASADQPNLVELAETLSENFESLYEKEVVTLIQKFEGYAKLDRISAETKKELDDILASMKEVPKAPWDEGVCKVCGVDKDDDSVLLCDTCDAEYHRYCLNPPLARIPEGNWYCPSCVVGKRAVPEGSVTTQVMQRHCKKYQGDVTPVYLETLSQLAVAMEEKEYWDFSVDERIHLLKFLCDELLNSALTRQHLEQSAETIAELQQKLRPLFIEWKNLKSREESLASRAAKEDASTVGELIVKEGLASAFINQDKCVGQSPNLNDRPSHSSALSDDMPALDGAREGTEFNGFDKHPPITNSEKIHNSDTQTLNPVDIEGQVKDSNADVDENNRSFHENEKRPNQLPLSNQLLEVIDDTGVVILQGTEQGNVGRDTSSLLPSPDQENSLSSESNVHGNHSVPPVALNESQAYHLELSTVKNDILHLQNMIASIESQLMKLSVRREFLGSDSRGHLYWASAMQGRHPRVIVDRSLAVQQGETSHPRDLADDCLVPQNSASSGLNTCLSLEGSIACFPFLYNPNNGMAMCSSWVSYETDSEIEELICCLKDNDQKERELKESILQWLKLRFRETQQTRNLDQEEHPVALSLVTNTDRKAFSNGLVTKAAVFLEKKYGSCVELGTCDMLKKHSKRMRLTGEEKMYRCDCLEPILASRHHCLSCHKTFCDNVAFEGHNDGKCNVVPPARERSAEINDSLKVRRKAKPVVAHEERISETDVLGTSKSDWSELSSRLIKFQNEVTECPYDFGEISSKFLTKDCNKELVQEIGLIGSNGIPSFLTSVSPYLSDSTLRLILPKKGTSVLGDEFGIDEKMVFSRGNSGEPVVGLENMHDNFCGKSSAHKIHKVLKTSKPKLGCLEHREQKSSLDKSSSELGVGRCCVVLQSSLRPLAGKVSPILGQLKINLLDIEAALPEEALRSSEMQLEKRWAWRAYVKSAKSIYEMVQATIILEEMIKTEYLRNEWWYWSSFSAAAKTSTVASLALRIYSLDAAVIYEKNLSNSDTTDCSKLCTILDQKPSPGLDPVDKCKISRKANKKRKEPEG